MPVFVSIRPRHRRIFCVSFDRGKGVEFEQDKLSLEDLRYYAVQNGGSGVPSGKTRIFEKPNKTLYLKPKVFDNRSKT